MREEAKEAGFDWNPDLGAWTTASAFKALSFLKYGSLSAVKALSGLDRAVKDSSAVNSILDVPAPEGLTYLPFQKAGIAYAAQHPTCLIGDEPGLGKTIQAIGLANLLGLERLLVICPAGLRLNWQREIEKWHIHNRGVQVVLNGKDRIRPGVSTIISYDLCERHAAKLHDQKYHLAVADEGHYLKNPSAMRTRLVLGLGKVPGLIHLAKRRLVLTGTPVPNRINEIYPIVRRLAPQVIDGLGYRSFLREYAVLINDGYKEVVVGIKNAPELYRRLRAGFMVRRLKANVLKDLPPKQYKMVIFSGSKDFARVLESEHQFNAREIIRNGAPVGSGLPEIRRRMGIAKIPYAVKYIKDVLEDGVQKLVVFAHHRDVIAGLEAGLREYGVLTVTGYTPATVRQKYVDLFQAGNSRVFLGNIQAAGTGITLTAASDVVFAEASWVPGENDQAADRCHRVGQLSSVLVHYLVVEGSLDAAILGSAARKQEDISNILDGKGI